jgi:hypothetical protein
VVAPRQALRFFCLPSRSGCPCAGASADRSRYGSNPAATGAGT